MTPIFLVEAIAGLIETLVAQRCLPAKGGGNGPEEKIPAVYLHEVGDAEENLAPYILIQVVKGKDVIDEEHGQMNKCSVIITIAAYSGEDAQGAVLDLLNLMMTIRTALEKQIVFGQQFVLDLTTGLEYLLRPENPADYRIGELMTTWDIPLIEREFNS